MGSWLEITTVAEQRHGLVTTADLRTAGIGDRQVTRWVANGYLVREARGVFRIGGCPTSTEASILAAILVHGPGTYASHRTAAWLWSITGFGRPGRIEVCRSTPLSNQRVAAVVHRTSKLPDHHHVVLRSIPVTSLPRTLFDLGGSMGLEPLDRAVESALRTRHCTIGSLFRVLEELSGKGRRGTANMRAILERRGPDYVATESELDVLGRTIVATTPGIEWQVPMSDERGYIRRVDGLHRESGLVIEWDGAEFHDTREQRGLDADGDRRLGSLGLHVVRYRWSDVTMRPAAVRHEVATFVAAASAASAAEPAQLGTLTGHSCP